MKRNITLYWIITSLFAAALSVAGCTERPAETESAASVASIDALSNAQIFTAAQVITMDGAKPSAEAIAVVDGRIAAVGSLAEMQSSVDPKTSQIIDTYKEQVIVAGLIDQHLHPTLAALTLNSSIVSIEDWQLPAKLWPAAKSHEDYLSKLTEIESSMTDADELLLSWGYHHYFHGSLTKSW